MALAPVALAGAVAGPAAGAIAATATAACSGWNGAQPVRPAPFSPLSGIAAISPCDVWAVGYQASSLGVDAEQPLIEHWTGSSWATAPISINPGFLNSVSAVSASDVWAAGDTQDGALVLHYDGTGWTRTPTPHDGDRTHLLAVDERTASDAWAGGYTGVGGGAGPVQAMMMRWDGTNWTPSALPAAVSGNGFEVFSVSADSATDAWAVANVPLTTSSALLHWNGSQWTSSTVNGPAGAVFSSVTALSPASAWAVGSFSAPGGHTQTLTEHWDGTSWNMVSSPNPGGTGQINELLAVTATSGSDIWAVGRYSGNSPYIPFAMHWNGGSWSVISLPVSGVQASDTFPESVSAAAPGQAWISGYSGSDTNGQFSPFAVPVPVVPDVTGQQASAASSALTAAGLTSIRNGVTNCSASLSGQVLSTDPAAGQQAPFGQAVTLTVCSATVITPTVTVPDVTGEDDASARSDITSAGLNVGTVTLKVDCTIPRGQVLSQSPAGGTSAPFGSPVNLTEATRSGRAVHQITPHFCTQ